MSNKARTPLPLVAIRQLIDRVDAAAVLLLALRGQLAKSAATHKSRHGRALLDPLREGQVRRHVRAVADDLGLPPASADRLCTALIDEAHRRQGLDTDQGDNGATGRMLEAAMNTPRLDSQFAESPAAASPWLRLVPPPWRLAPLLRVLPQSTQQRLLERALRRVLGSSLLAGDLDFLQQRRIAIEVSDVDLRWVISNEDGVLRALPRATEAEATVRGSLTDLLCLAGRLEDADTLFFQRRLDMTGDTELGLYARNLLERLPWEDLPLGLRIALNRCARLACAARTAYREHGAQTPTVSVSNLKDPAT